MRMRHHTYPICVYQHHHHHPHPFDATTSTRNVLHEHRANISRTKAQQHATLSIVHECNLLQMPNNMYALRSPYRWIGRDRFDGMHTKKCAFQPLFRSRYLSPRVSFALFFDRCADTNEWWMMTKSDFFFFSCTIWLLLVRAPKWNFIWSDIVALFVLCLLRGFVAHTYATRFLYETHLISHLVAKSQAVKIQKTFGSSSILFDDWFATHNCYMRALTRSIYRLDIECSIQFKRHTLCMCHSNHSNDSNISLQNLPPPPPSLLFVFKKITNDIAPFHLLHSDICEVERMSWRAHRRQTISCSFWEIKEFLWSAQTHTHSRRSLHSPTYFFSCTKHNQRAQQFKVMEWGLASLVRTWYEIVVMMMMTMVMMMIAPYGVLLYTYVGRRLRLFFFNFTIHFISFLHPTLRIECRFKVSKSMYIRRSIESTDTHRVIQR